MRTGKRSRRIRRHKSPLANGAQQQQQQQNPPQYGLAGTNARFLTLNAQIGASAHLKETGADFKEGRQWWRRAKRWRRSTPFFSWPALLQLLKLHLHPLPSQPTQWGSCEKAEGH